MFATAHEPGFGAAEIACAETLIALAIAEDFAEAGDLTSLATIPAEAQGSAVFVARESGVLCGLPVVSILIRQFGSGIVLMPTLSDGASLSRGDRIAEVCGPMRGILAMERTALNFLQRLSGVATMTRRFVELTEGTKAAILDTRKTTPGWRALEKYAVRRGGGRNHRIGLYDAVLIKDNHLAWLDRDPDPIGRAIADAKRLAPTASFIEIEVDSLEQFDRTLTTEADIVLLDNFTLSDLSEAVRRRDVTHSAILLEASGGVNLGTVASIAKTGVDRISVGALTHSAPSLDIALDEGAALP